MLLSPLMIVLNQRFLKKSDVTSSTSGSNVWLLEKCDYEQGILRISLAPAK